MISTDYSLSQEKEVSQPSYILGLMVLIMVLVLCRHWRLLSFEIPVSYVMVGVVEVKRDASRQDKSVI